MRRTIVDSFGLLFVLFWYGAFVFCLFDVSADKRDATKPTPPPPSKIRRPPPEQKTKKKQSQRKGEAKEDDDDERPRATRKTR